MESVQFIAITGGSGSGKTTASQKLQNILGHTNCQILSQDNYYKDQSKNFKGDGSVNFDHPNAIDFAFMAEQLQHLKNGQTVPVPLYDFATHTRKTETRLVSPTKFIIIDGILILTYAPLRALFDSIVFIDVPEEIRFVRRLKRDTTERGRTEEGVRVQFYNVVVPMHNEFVAPACQFAHYIASADEDVEQIINQLAKNLLEKRL